MKRVADVELRVLETTYYNEEVIKPKGIVNKVISGGQCGADKAGLEAAFKIGITTGGTAPKGFITSKGRDPTLGTKYLLKELEDPSGKVSISQMYVLRSKKNVDDSDGVLAFRLAASKGTDLSIGYALTRKWQSLGTNALDEKFKTRYRPCLVITSLDEKDDEGNIKSIRQFIALHHIECLNIIGHREEVIPNFTKRITQVLIAALSTK